MSDRKPSPSAIARQTAMTALDQQVTAYESERTSLQLEMQSLDQADPQTKQLVDRLKELTESRLEAGRAYQPIVARLNEVFREIRLTREVRQDVSHIKTQVAASRQTATTALDQKIAELETELNSLHHQESNLKRADATATQQIELLNAQIESRRLGNPRYQILAARMRQIDKEVKGVEKLIDSVKGVHTSEEPRRHACVL